MLGEFEVAAAACRPALLEANLRKEVAPVVEVERLLRGLRDAWAEMLTKQEGPTAPDRVRGVA
mgnify:CR=1 FL=1